MAAKRPDMVRIATRRSALALWQARHVAASLQQYHPGLTTSLVEVTTTGDREQGVALTKIGGKGLFLKELEQALLDNRADIAVHSMKDVPAALPQALHIPVICARADPRDAFVSAHLSSLDKEVATDAVIGTSSLRRQACLLHRYPHLNLTFLRGNVDTRLQKLDAGGYDGIILAAAGLVRLGLQARIRAYLTPAQCLPAPGQGAIGIELAREREDLLTLIRPLHHEPSAACVLAERRVAEMLGAGCHVPFGAYACITQDRLHLQSCTGYPDGSGMLHASVSASPDEYIQAAQQAGESLLRRGAADILAAL